MKVIPLSTRILSVKCLLTLSTVLGSQWSPKYLLLGVQINPKQTKTTSHTIQLSYRLNNTPQKTAQDGTLPLPVPPYNSAICSRWLIWEEPRISSINHIDRRLAASILLGSVFTGRMGEGAWWVVRPSNGEDSWRVWFVVTHVQSGVRCESGPRVGVKL